MNKKKRRTVLNEKDLEDARREKKSGFISVYIHVIGYSVDMIGLYHTTNKQKNEDHISIEN
jgi:hypothetical protein